MSERAEKFKQALASNPVAVETALSAQINALVNHLVDQAAGDENATSQAHHDPVSVEAAINKGIRMVVHEDGKSRTNDCDRVRSYMDESITIASIL